MQRNKELMKGLIIVIIVLFIGTSILPTISGNFVETSIKSTIHGINKLLLTDDYVNGYWKFDEGSGNTAYDSSAHNFDGTIYGATWTTGHSSYALDFDGVNDYVNLDAYALNNLGFNKTDDLLFDFYFQTTSTNEGIIYSMCHSYGYNPGVHIAMNSDGTLQFRVWRLSCGIMLDSSDTYNNGNWHHVKIFYNGITSNPTVKIYVDETLDTEITYWVCDFHADQFNFAKIGMQANDSINFFDGKIDEFKITKYPGGNEQNPPTISGPTIGNPGVKYDFTFITQDPEADDIWLYIDWDDGTFEDWIGPYKSGEEVVVSHKWDVDDRFVIKAKSQDYWHSSYWSEYVVKIGNQPPEPPKTSGPKYGNPQQQLTYTFVAGDEEKEDVKYFIDWDDGTTDETNYVQSNTSVQLSHSWETESDYNITAKGYDIHGKPGDPSVYHIRIGDQPPNIPKIYGAIRGTQDIEYKYGFLSIDPENDNLRYDIDWGDGNTETDIGPYPSGEIFPRYHSWNKTGTYLVKARVKDEFDYYSDWSEHKISVPRNKVINYNPIELLFERFPLVFLKFNYLLGLLKYDLKLLENLL